MENLSFYRPSSHILSAIESVALTTWVSETLELGAKHLVIDFQRVLFMDSRGLGALIIAHNRAQKAGAKLGLCGLSGQARMLMEVSSTDALFQIYETIEDFQQEIQPYPKAA